MPRASFVQQQRQGFQIIQPQRYLARISGSGSQTVGDLPVMDRRGSEWQRDAFAYNELIGEIGYLHNLTANLVAACDLRVIQRTVTDGGVITATTTDARAARVMSAFAGPIGGTPELMRMAALHYQIAGESLLIGTSLVDEHGQERGISWEFVSSEELKFEAERLPGGKTKTKIKRNKFGRGGGDAAYIEMSAYASRFYRKDPRFSGQADSAMKRILTLCRELIVLSEVVDAIAKSQIPANMLLLPDELSLGPDDETVEDAGEGEDDIDPLSREVIDHMKRAVEERTSAASLVPLLLRGAAEYLKEVRVVDLTRNLDETWSKLRAELLRRIAQGLDAPPEIMTGKAALNHWSAYNVDADFIGKHVSPIGQALAEFLTIAYLRPMLVKFENMSEVEAEQFWLAFDPSPITGIQDEGAAATAAWDRITLSTDKYLRSNGFDRSDYPSEEEAKRRRLEQVLASAPSQMGPYILPLLYPDDPDLVAAMQEAILADAGAMPAGTTGTAVVPAEPPTAVGPPTAQPTRQPSPSAPGASVEALVDRLATAADAALERALERAANRVLSQASRPDLRDVPKTEVLAHLTVRDLREMRVNGEELFADAWEGLSQRSCGWVREWGLRTGMDVYAAESLASSVAKALAAELDEMVHDTDWAFPVGANGLRVSHEQVRRAFASGLDSAPN